MLYVLPARDTVIFPGVLAPIFVGRPGTLKAIELAATEKKRLIFVVAQRNPDDESAKPDNVYDVGTVCEMLQMIRMPDGSVKLLLEGKERRRSRAYVEEDGVMKADLVDVPTGYVDSERLEALRQEVLREFENYVDSHPRLPTEIIQPVAKLKDPSQTADMVAAHMTLDVQRKQTLLECFRVDTRLELLLKYLISETELLRLGRKIHTKVQQEVDQHQKEYFLREQLKAIQEELQIGSSPEVAELQERAQKLDLPDVVREKVESELKRMGKMQPMSPESSVVRSYVEWLLDVPWKVKAEECLDITAAAKTLDSNHYGLTRVKDRLLEYLAVRKLAGKSSRAQIICLVGPPGVGKTSLGKSVAEALHRPFVSFSLGGMRDEAEIRGHRRTYIGALPGRIVQKLKEAGCSNPVILLDEVDKIGSDFRGDPASALLEVLDPEQNSHFTDHYLEVPVDLSDVLFITTANVADTIPAPLLDRMDVIELSSYLPEEKYHIARQHLLPRIYKETGMTKKDIVLSVQALKSIIADYTFEAGVRQLDRKLSTLFRKIARIHLERQENGENTPQIRVGVKDLPTYLGAPHRPDVRLPKVPSVGIAVGLAWTAAGGDVLSIEAVKMSGKGDLQLTGNLGKVMQESAMTALGFLKSHWVMLTKQPEPDWGSIGLHIHVPEGAIPKDGPSAGITMAIALFSALTGAKYLPGYAMTGEISLRGDVLPIGGLREKTLAAKRYGIYNLFVPEANRPDVEDMDEWIKDKVSYHFVKEAEQVFSAVFEKDGPAEPLPEGEGETAPAEPATAESPDAKPAATAPETSQADDGGHE